MFTYECQGLIDKPWSQGSDKSKVSHQQRAAQRQTRLPRSDAILQASGLNPTQVVSWYHAVVFGIR